MDEHALSTETTQRARKRSTGDGGGRAAKGHRRYSPGPVAVAVYLPLTAGDDGDRRLPGHEWDHLHHPNSLCVESCESPVGPVASFKPSP